MSTKATTAATPRPLPALPPLRTRVRSETVGAASLEITPLQIASLENLDQTIDDLFEVLQTTGDEGLLDSLCPYFGVVWPSARALAAIVAELPDASLRGRRVLELGCGLALPSLVAARRGARVTATDFHPDVPELLARNLALNGLAPDAVAYARLNWQEPQSWEVAARLGQAGGDGGFDLVIASDVLYERHQPSIVAAAITGALAPGGRAILTDPARPYLQAFVDQMTTRGRVAVTDVRVVPDTPAPREIFVLSFGG